MVLDDLVHWYQKKIGTYDKQQWEKTIEQRIFGGFNNVPMRTAKLKTELIDVDLVRGSSFPKAKPKHGLGTVTLLAARRLLFLPLYRRWWIRQTSRLVFALFLLLYGLQLLNMCIYFSVADSDRPNMVSSAEVLMPLGMMFVLCTVHSQIVSTNSVPATVPSAKNRSRVRRSRHDRRRSGKLRSQRHFRSSNGTESESVNDGRSKIRSNASSSVTFAKRVRVERSTATGGRPGIRPQGLESVRPLIEEPATKRASPESTISPVEEQPSSSASSSSSLSSSSSSDDATIAAENDLANANTVHQDDDGFESLNGNVSSDNDRSIVREGGPHCDENNGDGDDGNQIDEEEGEAGNSVAPVEENTDPVEPFPLQSTETSKKIQSDREQDPGDHSKARSREGRQQCESEEEGECEETAINHMTEATTSATEWMGVTTNSDVCSYSSDLEESERHSEAANLGHADFAEYPFPWELEPPASILINSSCTSSDRVSCTIWTRRDIKKAQLSVFDISSAIIARVESMPAGGMDYFYCGLWLSLVLSLVPSLKRLGEEFGTESSSNLTGSTIHVGQLARLVLDTWSERLCNVIDVAFGSTLRERILVLALAFEKLALSCLLFFLLAVAERTFKQRLLHAKLFSHLTSSRRARKSDLPHFRLNKVRNIKTWLSVRSYLKRRGPQRSVDVIVSAVFIVTLLLLSFVCLELIKDPESLHSRCNVEALLWSFALGIYILRFMTLGTKINKKYRNLSILITEQINLYLQIEQKPHKKDELMVANSVLKLAADLIKELECPFKISGLSANPYLYTITKVVLLSALSAVLSELLGFKLKLHKISIK